jgi:hypothetical protein
MNEGFVVRSAVEAPALTSEKIEPSHEWLDLLDRVAVLLPPELTGDAYVQAVNERHEAELELLRRARELQVHVEVLTKALQFYANEEGWFTLVPVVGFYADGRYGPSRAKAVCGRRPDWYYGPVVDEEGVVARAALRGVLLKTAAER